METFVINWYGKKIKLKVEYFIEDCSLSHYNYTPAKVEVDTAICGERLINLEKIKDDFKSLIQESILQKDSQQKPAFNGQFIYN